MATVYDSDQETLKQSQQAVQGALGKTLEKLPADEDQFQQRKGKWKGFLETMEKSPEMQQFLITAGLTMASGGADNMGEALKNSVGAGFKAISNYHQLQEEQRRREFEENQTVQNDAAERAQRMAAADLNIRQGQQLNDGNSLEFQLAFQNAKLEARKQAIAEAKIIAESSPEGERIEGADYSFLQTDKIMSVYADLGFQLGGDNAMDAYADTRINFNDDGEKESISAGKTLEETAITMYENGSSLEDIERFLGAQAGRFSGASIYRVWQNVRPKLKDMASNRRRQAEEASRRGVTKVKNEEKIEERTSDALDKLGNTLGIGGEKQVINLR